MAGKTLKKNSDRAAPLDVSKLSAEAKAWFDAVIELYEMESHHVKLLALAAEAWDRTRQAREALERYGLTYTDRLGNVKARPEVQIEQSSRVAFARLLRELNLDVDTPTASVVDDFEGVPRLRAAK